MDERSIELRSNLAAVRTRIEDAALAAGRADRPELIVVTKYFPAADVLRLHRLGVTQIGENKDQEAAGKAAEVAETLHRDATRSGPPPRWHFIGQLQTNKANSVVRYASAVHSVDRIKLANALAKAHTRATAEHDDVADPLDCLIQVDLRQPAQGDGRGGTAPELVDQLAETIAAAQGLRLAGLMAVAPLGEDPGAAFERLAILHQELLAQHPEARMLSAGMSQDLEAAVAHGATHLRIGRDVLGERQYPG